MIGTGAAKACAVLMAGAMTLHAQGPGAGVAYKYFRVGNAADASGAKFRAGYALMGGGKDLDEAFQWLCERAGGGDFLIVRATGTDAYNAYVQGLCTLNSVATLVIPTRAAAMDGFVAQTIAHASAIFIAGGDQANYINFWKDTPVQTAIDEAIKRGVPIGGTSAGLAVMGEYAYSAQGDKPDDKDLDSKSVLSDPFNPRVTLVHGFLEIPILQNIVTDSHFVKRDRMGRLLGFLARLNGTDGKSKTPKVRGMGIEERAAVLLEPDGRTTIMGNGSAYFVELKNDASILAPGSPLTLNLADVQKVASGHAFSLATWKGDAAHYTLSVDAGVVHSTQAGEAIY
jgi:cyanophycinase